MRLIISPLNLGDTGTEVANLQAGLLLLLRKRVIQVSDEDRGFFEESLQREQTDQRYSDVTEKVIRIFQEQFHLTINGKVDEPTAEALNRMLRELGVFDDSPDLFKVSGRVLDKTLLPVGSGILVKAYDIDLRSVDIYDTAKSIHELKESNGFEFLGETQADDNGAYEISFRREDFAKAEIGFADVIVYAFDNDQIIGRSGIARSRDYKDDKEISDWDVYLQEVEQRPPTEYKTALDAVTPLLGDLPLYELNQSVRKTQFVADETGMDFNIIYTLGQADKLWNDIDQIVSADFKDAFKELFYGVGRGNNGQITLNWIAINSQIKDLKGAIQDAISTNKIQAFGDELIGTDLPLSSGRYHF